MPNIALYDTKGNTVATDDLPDGMYIVKIVTRAGALHTKKLIIRH